MNLNSIIKSTSNYIREFYIFLQLESNIYCYLILLVFYFDIVLFLILIIKYSTKLHLIV